MAHPYLYTWPYDLTRCGPGHGLDSGAGDPDNPQFKFAGLVWDDLTPAQQALVG